MNREGNFTNIDMVCFEMERQAMKAINDLKGDYESKIEKPELGTMTRI